VVELGKLMVQENHYAAMVRWLWAEWNCMNRLFQTWCGQEWNEHMKYLVQSLYVGVKREEDNIKASGGLTVWES
jgi:hypothetical protein